MSEKFFEFKSDKKTAKILAVLILIYTAIFSAFCWWKYLKFGYDGLDLAIFNQVFFNTVHGNLFAFSIHPHSYLGDHAEFIILLLAPLYALWQSPLCLLFLQTLVIALCAWPLFLIAKKILTVNWALLVACLWLVNPFLQNMALCEFHILPFAMFTLLWLFYFWQSERFKPFLIFLFLSLLVREDVSLVVMFFGLFSFIMKRRQFKWSWLPFILGAGWFYLTMKIIGHFTPAGSYKFLIYYSWLGDSLPEMIKSIFTQPLLVLSSLATPNNLFLITILALFFLGLNFFASAYLIPTIPILAQLILGGRLNSAVVLQTHYSSLLMVFWFISLVYGLRRIFLFSAGNGFPIFFLKNLKKAVFLSLLIITLYFSWNFGPIAGLLKELKITNIKPVVLQQAITKQVTNDQAVATTFDFLPFFSNREHLCSLYYVYLGHKQFSIIPYNLPEETEVVAINFQEALDYWVLRNGNATNKRYYLNGTKNWSDIFTVHGFKAVDLRDTFALLKRQEKDGIELYAVNPKEAEIVWPAKSVLDDNLSLMGFSSWNGVLTEADLLPLSIFFQTKNTQAVDDYQFRLILVDKNNQELYQRDYPLGYGLFPTGLWPKNSVVKMNYNFWIPRAIKIKKPTNICWEFFKAGGDRILNRLGTNEFVFDNYEVVARRCLPLNILVKE